MSGHQVKQINPPFLSTSCVDFARGTVVLAGVVGVISLIFAAVSFLALRNPSGELLRLVLAVVVSGFGGMAGLAVLCFSRGTVWELWAPLAATPVRTAATLLSLALLLVLPAGLVTTSFLLYLIVFYISILGCETILALQQLRKNTASIGSAVRGDGAKRRCGMINHSESR